MMNHNNGSGEYRGKSSATVSQTCGYNGGSTGSWDTTISGESVSTSGSVGSSSAPTEAAISGIVIKRLSNNNAQRNVAANKGNAGNKKAKRAQRTVTVDKRGRGLRQFSMKVCEKVKNKGSTTYNEVADEVVAEFADPNFGRSSNDQQFDEKNIRRRVYDALNVLMAMDIIYKDRKKIQWKGLPRTSSIDIEELKNQRTELLHRIENKAEYLLELDAQYTGLQNLVQRNKQLYGSGNIPSGGILLPFVLVQTHPQAAIEVEISEDMQLAHFDFDSTPFELHGDDDVLKAMKL